MNYRGRARGRCFQWALLAGVFALVFSPSLYGGGRQDTPGAAREGTVGGETEFDEALRLLSEYTEEDPAAVTEKEKRRWEIILRQEGYNTLPQDMQDVLKTAPDDSAKLLDLIERIELLAPVMEVDGQVLAQVRELALFGFNRRQLDMVMARGRVLLNRGDYAAALGCYADGLDIYQEEFFDIGYGRDINTPVRNSLAAIAEGRDSFSRLQSSFKGAGAGIDRIGISGDGTALTRLREYHARLMPLTEHLITLNKTLAEAGNDFDAQLARIRERYPGLGDRSFLFFASRLVHGPGGSRDEGMLGVIAAFWDSVQSPFDAALAANTEKAYQNAYAAFEKRDFTQSRRQFESVVAFSALAMECFDDRLRFYQGQGIPTYQYFDDTVLASQAEAYLRYVSLLLASESLQGAGPLLEQYGRIVSMTAANSPAREADLRRMCRELARSVEPVLEGLRANAEILQKYASALTGKGLRYPSIEQALSCYRGMDTFPQEAVLTVREYTLENQDFRKQVTEWQTRLNEASRGSPENPAGAQGLFAGIIQGTAPALAAGEALVARYDGEPPRIAGELAGLSREARALVRELEAIRAQAGAQEENARVQAKELEERRAAALVRELDRIHAEAQAQEEQARTQALAEEERRAKAIAREVEEMRAKSLAEEIERLRTAARTQEELARSQALTEEERRAQELSLELEKLQTEAQATAQAKARAQEIEVREAKARTEELERLRAETLAQEEQARARALAEEERRAQALTRELEELQAEAEAKVQARARAEELEKLRVEAQAQEGLARSSALTEEERRAQALTRELEVSRTQALSRELEEDRTKTLARELEDLQAAIQARQNLTPAQIAQAEILKQEGDRYQQEARSALSQNNYDRARDRVLRAGEKYDAALDIQETAETRNARDIALVSLGTEINRQENQAVIREVRPMVTRTQEAYETGNFEEAEQILVRALNLWRRTNVEDDSELTYWLTIVRGALTLRAGRVIPVTAPLYAEMSQLLSEARKLYNEGAALVNGNKRAEGIVKFEEARRKTHEVKLVFPINEEANRLELRIAQVTDPAAFNADFRRRLTEAVAGTKRKDMASYAALKDLEEINPGYPGIRGMVIQAEIDLGVRPPPPDTRALDRAAELTASARGIIDRNEAARFPAALAQLNQALVLNPANRQVSALKDRLQTLQSSGGGGGGAPLVLSSAAEREYQRAVRELQQGNTLVARDIVQQLMVDPRNRTTRLTDLQRRIASYL
ncbi:hypothetical protein AGMMS4952_17700 [Spirochaetia bacterium]|nr:hypothetical protein AGMMS4952_17700 [Spirochaetia bacterium]